MYELYSTKEKIYFLICGLIITSAILWTTYIYYDTRVTHKMWAQTFTTPQEFWDIEKARR